MKTKILTYSSLAIASLFVILAFVTAKTYAQLVAAVLLYPILIFLFFKIFPRESLRLPKITIAIGTPSKTNLTRLQTPNPGKESLEAGVVDINRRTFIKLIWATGISFLLLSIFGRRIQNIFSSGSDEHPGMTERNFLQQIGQSNTSSVDGYKISEIDEGSTVSYYGFVDKFGAWIVMKEDGEENSFRYVKGKLDFPENWKNRAKLNYDYFYNLF